LFFQQQMDETKDKLTKAEEALKEFQQKSGLIQPDSQSKAMIGSMVELQAMIAAKEVEVQSMKSFAAPGNPDLNLAERQLEGLRDQLSKLQRQRGPIVEGDIEVPTGKVPEVALQYIRKFRDVRYQEALYEQFGKQLEIAKVDEARDAVLIQVLDSAVVPDRRSYPLRWLVVLIGTLVTLIALSALILYTRSENVSSTQFGIWFKGFSRGQRSSSL
jgi:capsule polysaccharide export protein KpsE/RkpR